MLFSDAAAAARPPGVGQRHPMGPSIAKESSECFDPDEAVVDTQATLLASVDGLRLEMKDLQTDVRQVLSLLMASEAQVHRQRSLQQMCQVSTSAQHRSRLHPPSDSGMQAQPSRSDPLHKREDAAGEATVVLEPRKSSMMQKSMSMRDMGRMSEISALLPEGWPKTVICRAFLEHAPGPAGGTKLLADIVRQVSIRSSGNTSCGSHSSSCSRRSSGHSSSFAADAASKSFHSDGEDGSPPANHLHGGRQTTPQILSRLGWAGGALPALHPHSKVRLFFDFFALSVLVYELFFIPFMLSWPEEDDAGYFRMSALCIAAFWLFDIVLSFCSGFYRVEDGEVELRWKVIAIHYLKSWFLADLVAAGGDWLHLILTVAARGGNSASVSRLLRLAKLGRFVRLLGLMRLVRIIALLNQKLEAQILEAWRLVARICQMSFLLLWFAHITACVWNAIGVNIRKADTGESWVDTPMGIGGTRYEEFHVAYQYCTAYSWAMSQIALGGHDVNPVNTPERLFAILINIFGLIFGGTVVSVLSTTLIEFKEINKHTLEKLRTLRHFLQQHAVNLDVSGRVLAQVQVRARHGKLTMASDVEALQLLSSNLRADLHHALFASHLLSLPLFSTWEHMWSEGIRHLCAEGVHFALVMAEDELFNTGLVAQAAYYIIEGSMTYAQEGAHGQDDVHRVCTHVLKHTWLSEAALWVDWLHAGNATAEAVCKLLTVSPEAVIAALQKNDIIRSMTRHYGKLFHRCITESSTLSLPNDLDVVHATFPELLLAMPLETQQIVGLASLEFTVAKHGRRKVERSMMADIDVVEHRIRCGQLCLWVDTHKEPHQQSSELELRQVLRRSMLLLERSLDGFRLAQVARRSLSNGGWELACSLPSAVPGVHELPIDALRRMIKHRMPALRGSMNIARMKTERAEIAGDDHVRALSCETTFQAYATDATVAAIQAHSESSHLVPEWCKDVAAATINYWVHHLGLSPPSVALDTLHEEVEAFAASPIVYTFRNGAFMWMPEKVIGFLALPQEPQHRGLRAPPWLRDLEKETAAAAPQDSQSEDEDHDIAEESAERSAADLLDF